MSRAHPRTCVLGAVVALLLAGCAQGVSTSPSPSAEDTVASTPPASPSVSVPTTPQPSVSATPQPSAPTTEPPSSPTTPPPSPTTQTGRELHLTDFRTDDQWKEDNFAIPKIGEVAGIATGVRTCEDSRAATLEFRADGDYRRLDLSAAPGKDTEDSSRTLVVALYDNETFIDSKKIAYGNVARFKKVNIADVSALKIKVWTQKSDCWSGDDVFAVLCDIVVS